MFKIKPTFPLDSKFSSLSQQSAKSILSAKHLGFWQLPVREELMMQSVHWGKELQKNGSRLLLFGVGGSSLGPQFLSELYGKQRGQVGICDNVDSNYLAQIWGSPKDWKQGSFVIISKSGSTLETLAMVQRFHEFVKDDSPEWFKRALVISEPAENPLTLWAKRNSIPQVEFPVDVGGRFSVLTPVGMVVAAFLDLQVQEFLRGANSVLAEESLAVEMIGQTLQSFERNEWITMFWSYGSIFRSYGSWLCQLWAESLAKKTTLDGKPAPRVSTPVACVGSTDQHSILQQVMEGHRDKMVVIHKFNSMEKMGQIGTDLLFSKTEVLRGRSLGQILNCQADATVAALRLQGVNVVEIEVNDFSPKSIGGLLMFWEWVVAGLGSSLNIDAFNQPGVELGKRLTLENLAR